jgi:dinuclear metal center YbgI/SA1388 family protein
VPLATLQRYLDRYLRVRAVPEVEGITNGLQVTNSGAIDAIAAAVDACQATIEAAAVSGRALLLVHHGLPTSAIGDRARPKGRRFQALRRSDVAVYASHIPLDLHPRVGNNAILAGLLGLEHRRPFGRFHRTRIGIEGRLVLPLRTLARRLEGLLGSPPYVIAQGPARTHRVAVVTGNGSRWIGEAADRGIDTLVTGESGHHDYLEAEAAGVNVVCGGHYATETFGVKALASHLARRFGLPWGFIDHPTGL